MSASDFPLLPSKQIVVSGIELDVFGLEDLPATGPVAVAFHLHGRGSSRRSLLKAASVIYQHIKSQDDQPSSHLPLILVLLDQRNHGSRLIEEVRNFGWSERKDQPNPSHAIDMYSLQLGTAQDVSLLIDCLPAVLFPQDEHEVQRWICMGVSLGGHATWIAGAQDKRITHLCPLIGSPSATSLLKDRAAQQGLPFAAPAFPLSFQQLLLKTDPFGLDVGVWQGKDIMVISAAEDSLVNYWKGASDQMVDKLKAAGVQVDVHLEPDLGHSVNLTMMQRCAQWLCSSALILN